ncbi:MAG: lysophospholipid acyltransferase family protein [Nitrospirota bacterium]
MIDIVKWVLWFPIRETLRFFLLIVPYHYVYNIGNLLGTIAYYLLPLNRKIVMDEVNILMEGKLSNRELKYIAKETFRMMINNEIDGMLFEDFTPERIKEVTEFEGIENLDAALNKGKGAILILVHFGWHMHVIPALSLLGYKICQVGDFEPNVANERKGIIKNALIKKRLRNAEKLPMTFIKAQDFLRPLYNTLKENKIVIIAIDGPIGKDKKYFDFMNRKISLSTSPFRIASSTGAQILPLFNVRKEDQKHKIIIGDPLTDETEDVNIKNFLEILQKEFIRRPWNYALYIMYNRVRFAKIQGKPLFMEWDLKK